MKTTLINTVQYSIWFLLFIVFTLGASPADAGDPKTIEKINAKKQGLLAATQTWKNKGSSDAAWLDKYLKQKTAKAGKIKKGSVAAKDLRRALHSLTRLGKKEHLLFESTGFVQDPAIIDILVEALKEEDTEVHRFILDVLTWNIKLKDLRTYSSRIKAGLSLPLQPFEIHLFAKLPLNDDDKVLLKDKTDLPPEILARLGNTVSESDLISAFNNQQDYFKKKNLAKLLGYIGTRSCAEALIKALSSFVQLKSMYENISIRCPVLLALGQIYQDEPLFTRKALFLYENGEAAFARNDDILNYLNQIDNWALKHFGMKAWGNQPVWFIKYHAVPKTMPPDSVQ